ncbi:MAG: hypothetical protein ACYTE8_12255 [Planctomycetota bacterium]|jgi:ABC-type transport system involved in multi-copper enzyme maturation permease subunit
MFTLIKREIIDNFVFFLAAALLGSILAGIMFTMSLGDGTETVLARFMGRSIFLPMAVVLLVGFSIMGAAQMVNDRTKKVYSVLVTKPVSRHQVLLAKMITGVVGILLVLIPVCIASVLWVHAIKPFEGEAFRVELFFPGLFFKTFLGIFVLVFACYCFGLLCGSSSERIVSTLGSIALSVLILPLVIIKGFCIEWFGIVLFVIVFCLLRIWKRFYSMSF